MRPQYVSSGTASIQFDLTAAAGGLPNPNPPVIVNVTTNGNGSTAGQCGPDSANPGNTLCTFAVSMPLGLDTFSVSTFDAPGGVAGGGNLLSRNSGSETVLQGAANSVSLTLNANPQNATITLTPLSDNTSGSANSGILVYGQADATFNVTVVDAAGKPIAGPGAPVLSIVAQSPVTATASISGSTVTVRYGYSRDSSLFTITAKSPDATDGLQPTNTSFYLAYTLATYGFSGYAIENFRSLNLRLKTAALPGDYIFAMVQSAYRDGSATWTPPDGSWHSLGALSGTAGSANLFYKVATFSDANGPDYQFFCSNADSVAGQAFALQAGGIDMAALHASEVDHVTPLSITGNDLTPANSHEQFLLLSGVSPSNNGPRDFSSTLVPNEMLFGAVDGLSQNPAPRLRAWIGRGPIVAPAVTWMGTSPGIETASTATFYSVGLLPP